MGALTVGQSISEALHELGVSALGEPDQPEYVAIGQTRVNWVLDAWKVDRLMIFQVLRQLYTLTPTTASYTIGPGATWEIATRPLAIVRAGFVNTAVNPSEPLETPIHVYTDEEWAAIGLKTLTSTIVWGIWYETSWKLTAPVGSGKIFVYPILTSTAQIALYLPVAMDEVADDENGLAVVMYMPPGYRRAFVTSMAMEMADAMRIEPKPSLVAKWKLAMKTVKKSNIKPMILRLPIGLMRRRNYNILTNQ